MTNNEMKITVQQLRSLLFNIDNEDLTVKELRRQLFDLSDQDQKLTDNFNAFSKLGIGIRERSNE